MFGISRRMLIACSILALPLLALSTFAGQNEISGVNVVPGDGKVRIEIAKSGDVSFNAFMAADPARLVINCVGATYGVPWQTREVQSPIVRTVRTSQFQVSPIVISRVVLDLATDVDYKMWADGNKEIVEVTRRVPGAMSSEAQESAALMQPLERPEGAQKREAATNGPVKQAVPVSQPVAKASMGSFTPFIPNLTAAEQAQLTASAKEAPAKTETAAARNAAAPAEDADSPWITSDEPKSGESDAAVSVSESEDAAYSPLSETDKTETRPPWSESYLRGNPAAGSGKASGSNRITIDAQGADIKTILRTISDYSGKNIVYGPDVKGEVYVHIKDVPWEEALDIILRAHGFGYREEFGMIRVSELSRLTKEELEIQSAERKKDDLLPLMTRIIFVNNSNAEEMKNALQNIVSQRGKIDVDRGSNSLIVNDTEPVISKIEEMVKSLDRKTFQVDINAKLVDVDVEATRELGIDWGLLNLHGDGFSGAGSAGVNAGIASSVGNVKFGTVRSWGELNAVLQMLEKSNKANIISNPRITTMDNREASILVGKEIPLIVADEAGNPITELTKIGIMLRVIPHVNSDRTITLDMHPEVSDLQSESTAQGGVIISTNEADTRVVVKNGETAVIGGLIKNSQTSVKIGVPILKDIPVLGWLFTSSSKADKKQELVIFVTPTIVE
jgi:type II secretory pathway component GspD/PulD (secretin)